MKSAADYSRAVAVAHEQHEAASMVLEKLRKKLLFDEADFYLLRKVVSQVRGAMFTCGLLHQFAYSLLSDLDSRFHSRKTVDMCHFKAIPGMKADYYFHEGPFYQALLEAWLCEDQFHLGVMLKAGERLRLIYAWSEACRSFGKCLRESEQRYKKYTPPLGAGGTPYMRFLFDPAHSSVAYRILHYLQPCFSPTASATSGTS